MSKMTVISHILALMCTSGPHFSNPKEFLYDFTSGIRKKPSFITLTTENFIEILAARWRFVTSFLSKRVGKKTAEYMFDRMFGCEDDEESSFGPQVIFRSVVKPYMYEPLAKRRRIEEVAVVPCDSEKGDRGLEPEDPTDVS